MKKKSLQILSNLDKVAKEPSYKCHHKTNRIKKISAFSPRANNYTLHTARKDLFFTTLIEKRVKRTKSIYRREEGLGPIFVGMLDLVLIM